MIDLLQALQRALDGKRPLCYCRLVETRGSTPQKAGAIMLVFEDGSQAGTLGGGCVEAEVKRRALQLLAEGKAEVCRFTLDHDYGWDDGLICGGRMSILIDPLQPTAASFAEREEYYRQLAQRGQAGEGLTEAIAFDAEASGVTVPQACLFDEQGELIAHWGEAAKSTVLREHLISLLSRPRPYASHGIAYLPLLSRCRLVIVGGGHVGEAVARLAADLDFDVWVIDDRADYVTADRFPRAQQRISGKLETILPELEITPQTYCLIVTRGHSHDQEALYYLADRGARYVGMIGSRRKIKLIFEALQNEGVSAVALERVYAPLGIDIGSQTVPEIAVSICAELVAHRNRDGFVPGRPQAAWQMETSE